MDLESEHASSVAALVPRVQCCICGLLIDSNPSNMCPNCLRAHVDVTDAIQKEYIVIYCPECSRYLQPPKYWQRADLESRELLTLCLKRIKGLNSSASSNSNASKAKLVDAAFVWTEPHSKRLKVRLTVQKEVFNNIIIQQSCLIEYVVAWQQCPTCQKVATGQPQWDACVQVRQKVAHKKTFLYLEQIILRKRLHENFTRIENQPDGLDFYFGHKSHAMNFIEFLNKTAPVTRRDAVQLVSHDSKNNTAVQHFTFSLDIAPLCREDLVLVPYKDYYLRYLGGMGPLVLVHKVYSSIVFLDPRTLRAGEVQGSLYWKKPFACLLSSREMVDFYVLECTLLPVTNGTYQLGVVTVCLADEVGMGREWIVQSHLGAVLAPGDVAKGYLLEGRNFNQDDLTERRYTAEQVQEVVLVRKHFPGQRARRGRRNWRLKKLDVVTPHGDPATLGRQGGGGNKHKGGSGSGAADRDAEHDDMAEFEEEIERDKELRREIDIYRAVPAARPTTTTTTTTAAAAAQTAPRADAQGDEGAEAVDNNNNNDDDDDDAPAIALEEMLDELQLGSEADEATQDEHDAVAAVTSTDADDHVRHNGGDDKDNDDEEKAELTRLMREGSGGSKRHRIE